MPDGDFCVYCNTEDEAMELLEYLESEGFLWFSGTKPTSHTHWGMRRDQCGLWYCIDISSPYAQWEIMRFCDIFPNVRQPEIHSLADFL